MGRRGRGVKFARLGDYVEYGKKALGCRNVKEFAKKIKESGKAQGLSESSVTNMIYQYRDERMAGIEFKYEVISFVRKEIPEILKKKDRKE